MATFRASVSLRLATAASLEGLGMACSRAEQHVKQQSQMAAAWTSHSLHSCIFLSQQVWQHLHETA